MERNNDKISSAQLAAILASTMVGVGVLTLPRLVTEKVGPDGWILLIIGFVPILMMALLMAQLVKKFPKKTLVEFSGDILGRPLGIFISLGFVIYLLILTAVEARIFGEATKTYLLLNTPLEVLIMTLVITSVYLVRSGIEPIARMSQIVFPVAMGTAIFLFPILPEVDWTNLLPIFKTPILTMIKSLPVTVFAYVGIEVVLILGAFVTDTKKINKSIYISMGLVFIIYLSVIIITVTRFGLVETTHIIWPTLEVYKTVDLPGAFIENIENYIMAIWIFIVFMTMVVAYFGASLTLSRVVKSKEQNYLVLPLLPIIYYMAMFPDNLAQAFDYLDLYVNYAGTFYIFILPLLLLGVHLLKGGKGGKKSG